MNDTKPPTVRLLSRAVTRGGLLSLVVRDGGSGVDPQSLLALVDGHYRTLLYRPSTGRVEVVLGHKVARGRHRLVFSAADWQETKNNEDNSRTLPNTRRLSTTFTVR